ncbi:MAG: hypothetical protein H6620_05995 [Halobacteriovoraceae bacterium]|nr:hypothetical protein [Halobacteriovoraceae bacterium]
MFRLLFSVLFFVSSFNGHSACNRYFKDFITKPKLLGQEEQFAVKIKGQEFQIEYTFGESSSIVYLDKNREFIIKFYPEMQVDKFSIEGISKTPHRAQANYEYWVTQFYLEGGIPIPPVLYKPITMKHPHSGAKGTWIVKQYVDGIVLKSGGEQIDYDKELSFFRYVYRKNTIFKPSNERLEIIYDKLEASKNRVRLYHTEENFRTFLKEQGVFYPERLFRGFSRQWVTGDYFRNSNWIYTEKGWVLIDP